MKDRLRYRFPLDALYAQAFTNPIGIRVAGRAIRDAARTEYGLKWIDMLARMAEAWRGWMPRDEVKAQASGDFDAAPDVYRRFGGGGRLSVGRKEMTDMEFSRSVAAFGICRLAADEAHVESGR